jgi:hypothetical protein
MSKKSKRERGDRFKTELLRRDFNTRASTYLMVEAVVYTTVSFKTL